MFVKIKKQCDKLIEEFDSISDERKAILSKLSAYIQAKKDRNLPINLVYVCTHNSRRSHFGQVWAAVAASYYGIQNVHPFSGGTEATAFNSNAIQALIQTGFIVRPETEGENPVYTVKFGDSDQTECFSKVYNHPANPSSNFVAIMTCSEAEQNCPFIPGAEFKIASNYDDPKEFDNTAEQDAKYLERSNQIAQECLYIFSLIHNSFHLFPKT